MSSNEDNDPMAELKAKRKNVREKGGARAEASRNRRKESREKRARANAPENNATNNGGPKGGMGGLKTRFGREEQLKGNAGNQEVGGLGDGMSSDGSSGSDSDSNGSSEGSRLLDGGANKGSRRTRKEVRQSMVTQPVSLKFWKVAGDLDENSGGHVTFPTSTSRLNRDDKKKENQARTKKEANGPGSGFSVDKTPQFAESTAHSTTIGRVRRRLGQELQSDTLPASVTASKSTVQIKGQPINPDEVKENLTSDWFSSSGHIKTLSDPTDARRVMPSSLMVSGGAVDIVKPEEFRTTHNQGMMGNTAGTRGVGSRRSQIVFKFGRIRFSDHKDFKEEDIIAHNLKNLHAQYWKMIATDTESHHLTRVLACGAVLGAKRDEVVQYSLLEQKQGKELMDLAMDMYQAWSEYIGTFRTIRLLEKRVYDEWTRLKGHRETQGISCTSLHLEVRKMALPIDNEEGWNKITNTMRLLEDVLDLLEPKLLEKAPSMTGAGSSMRDRVAANFASFEANEIAVISGKTTSPIFLLSEKHAITSTSSLDPRTFGSEIKRRARIGNCRYYGRVVVNGYPVGKTRLAGLRWPEFELDFGSNMRIEVVRRPELVEFEIYKEGKLLEGSLVDTLVSSVPIALQGPTDTRTSASATAPVFAMYSFSASKSDIPYSSNLQLNGAKKNDGDDDDDDRDTSLFFLPKDGRYTSGRIEVTTSWLGWLSDKTELDGSDLWAPLPPERRDNERARLIGGPVDISGNLASKNNMANGTAKKTAGQHLEGSNLLNAVGNARLDPNDPENTKIMRLLRHRQLSSHHALRGSEPFRVESMPGSNNATFKSRDSTKFRVPERQNLLQLRYQRPHLFHNGKPLPLLDSEILQDPHWKVMLAPKNRLKLLGGQPTEDEEEEEPDYFGFDSEYLIKRQNKMKSFVEKVRLAQLELQGTRRSRGMLSRWVREGILPEFQLDLSFIMDKLAPKRKLKPKVKARKEAPLVKDVYVLVHVSSAFNVPMRRYGSERAVRDVAAAGGPSSPVRGNRRGRRPQSPDRQAKPDVATGTAAGGENPEDDMGGMSDYDDNSDDDEDMAGNARSCNAFVEGSFQGQHPRTSARGGTQPVWNETLRMRFIPSYSGTSSRWTSSNMNQVRDKVRISVFDEQVHQNEKDFRHKNSVNERRERRYLGTVSVPFTTIYRRKTIQGLFRLDRPEINLAYETPISPDADDDALGSSERTLKIASAEATYVNLMFTLDPPLQSMGDEDEDLSDAGIITSESANTLKRAAAFKASYFDKKRGPINIIVPTLNGERVMATRFLTPQKPPPEVSTYLEAARYVSLIPFMEDWQLFVGSEDMWSYSSQFLELCAGDWEEHAILLRNYFAYIDGRQFDNYIVFGHGLPEGDTVYVMRRPTDEIDNEIELWNASTGVAYARSDTRCALQTISCIVTEDNIYANIQPSISPSRMKFDFMNAKQWKPFFDEKHPLPEDYSASQPEIKYTPMPQKDLEGLERQIMETLRVDLKEWRSKHYQTYLNTTVARDLQKTLEGLENHKMGREGHSEYGHLDSLKKWTSTYDLIGHPLNFTFTDVKAISYAVKDTNIHMNEDPNVKFALTVKCFGYSNGIISVWVYCAALVRR